MCVILKVWIYKTSISLCWSLKKPEIWIHTHTHRHTHTHTSTRGQMWFKKKNLLPHPVSARIASHRCSNCHLGTQGVSSWSCTPSTMDQKSHEETLKSSSEVLVQQRALRSRAGKGPCQDHRILELISWWPLCSWHLPGLQVQGCLLFLFCKHEDSCFGEETKHSLTWTWADPKSIHATMLPNSGWPISLEGLLSLPQR